MIPKAKPLCFFPEDDLNNLTMFKLLLFIAILILIFGYRKRQKVKGGVNINTILMAALLVLFIISLLTRFQN